MAFSSPTILAAELISVEVFIKFTPYNISNNVSVFSSEYSTSDEKIRAYSISLLISLLLFSKNERRSTEKTENFIFDSISPSSRHFEKCLNTK
jgi:hypothetical protein